MVSFYLAGSIQKGHEKNGSFWTQEHMESLKQLLSPLKPNFLNPATRCDDLSDQHSVFGRDMLQVFSADFVFADVRERRGLGVGAEMMWAKFNRIPVIGWAPKNSHYRKEETSLLGVPVSDWVHPFVESLCDVIVESLEEGADWVKNHLKNPEAKGVEWIESAMHHYRDTQFAKDTPMQELAQNCDKLQSFVAQSLQKP